MEKLKATNTNLQLSEWLDGIITNGYKEIPCSIMVPLTINKDNKIISGYVKIKPSRMSELTFINAGTGTNNQPLADIDNYMHVYKEEQYRCNAMIKFDKYIVYRAYFNRYKSNDDLFRFMGNIGNPLELISRLKKGGNLDGRQNQEAIIGRN